MPRVRTGRSCGVTPEKEHPEDKRTDTASREAERSYYYDDAYGYENFDPKAEDGPDEKNDE